MFFANNLITAAGAYTGIITPGITDKDTEGSWKTFYGEPVPYENWNSGEPSGGAASNYAFIYSKQSETINGPSFPAGTWNDVGELYNNALCTYEPSVDGQLMFKFCIEKIRLMRFEDSDLN